MGSPQRSLSETMSSFISFLILSFLTWSSSSAQERSCTVNQECISIKECPYTRKLFAQVKATNDSEEKANLIQAIRVRVCGNPTYRTVCCDLQQVDESSFYPKRIGSISKLTYHPLSGDLWAIDDNTLEFNEFTYDGQGPDAFFIIGLQTASDTPNLNDAYVVPYAGSGASRNAYSINDNDIPVLPRFDQERVQLKLPPGIQVSDVQWLSLFCRDFNIDFGNVKF